MQKITRIEQAIGIDKINSFLAIGMQPLGTPMLDGRGLVHMIMVQYEDEVIDGGTFGDETMPTTAEQPAPPKARQPKR
mgnify:CR=1 FL=1